MSPLPSFQLQLDGLSNEVRPILVLGQNGLNSVKRPLWEPSLHILGPHLFPAHDNYFSYEVLTMDKSYEICGSQSREMLMAKKPAFYTMPEDHQNCPVGAFTHGVTLAPAKAQELQSLVGLMVAAVPAERRGG